MWNVFKKYQQWSVVVLVTIAGVSMNACDPCRQLAEKICRCIPEEEEKQLCLSNLSLPPQHQYFPNSKEEGICEQALKKDCSCERINNLDDAECEMYRKRPAR